MPTIQIQIFKGRTINEKRKLVESVTNAVVESLGIQRDAVKITIIEIPKTNYAQAGILSSDRRE